MFMSSADAPATIPSGAIPALRVRLGDFGVIYNQRTGKLEIYRADRKDLAHLTVAWGTKSGELDIHLTRGHESAMVGAGGKDYESLVRIPRTALEQVGIRVQRIVDESLVPQLMAIYRKYRPGWFGRRGYTIVFVEGDELRAWVGRAAPRVRGKYQLEADRIVDPANYPPSFVDSIYYPSVLDEIRDLALDIPVSAIRSRRGKVVSRDTITLRYTLGPDGTFGWWGTRQSDLRSAVRWSMAVISEIVLSIFGADYEMKLERILVGLGVDAEERARILRTVTSDIIASATLRAQPSSAHAFRESIST
jgi:hypothetical protein